METWSRPPRHGSTGCADPEATWGHRNSNLPGPKGEMFFGYYLSAAVMTREEDRPPVPELARRITLAGCDHDPVRQLATTLLRMAAAGIPPGDIIDDSGYAHRDAGALAVPLRNAGAQLVQDLHPHDRGPSGTHEGAVIANGCLYCPQTPRTLLAPLPPAATGEQTAAHDQQTAELSRYKRGRHTADDADGYHRAGCPAAAGKIRCPLRPDSMLCGDLGEGEYAGVAGPLPAAAQLGLPLRARAVRRRPAAGLFGVHPHRGAAERLAGHPRSWSLPRQPRAGALPAAVAPRRSGGGGHRVVLPGRTGGHPRSGRQGVRGRCGGRRSACPRPGHHPLPPRPVLRAQP